MSHERRSFGNRTLIETAGGGVRTPNASPGRAQRRALVARYRRTAEGRALLAELRATQRQARMQVAAKAVGRTNAALRREDTYAIAATPTRDQE